MGCWHSRVSVAAVLVALAGPGCSLLSGVDQLQKVDCVADCDGGADATSGTGGDSSASADTGGAGEGSTIPGADAAGGSSAYRAAVLDDSPVGYWRLGDRAGSNSCHDESGHGHDGTVAGGVILGSTGALSKDANTAATFDGTGTIDVGGSFTFSGSAPFSWEIWIKPSVLDATYRPFLSSMTFDGSGAPTDGSYMIAYAQSGDTFGFERYNGSATAVIALDTPALKVNVWTYIVATSNGIVYTNGHATISSTNTGSVPPYVADTIFGTLFKGELDEVAIYDHVLTANAVLTHWNASTQ